MRAVHNSGSKMAADSPALKKTMEEFRKTGDNMVNMYGGKLRAVSQKF